MGRRIDDHIFWARELRRYASCTTELGLGNWASGSGHPARHLPTGRPISFGHAGMRPQAWLAPQTGGEAARRRQMEHRFGKRYRAFRLVKLRQDSARETAGLLYNVSRNGMFVVTRNPQIGSSLCIDVDLPVRNGPPVRLSTLIVHRSEFGLGLIFRHLDPAAAAAVEELCNHR